MTEETAGTFGTDWCSSCLANDHTHCVADWWNRRVRRPWWSAFTRKMPCGCPHNERGYTADEIAEMLGVPDES